MIMEVKLVNQDISYASKLTRWAYSEDIVKDM